MMRWLLLAAAAIAAFLLGNVLAEDAPKANEVVAELKELDVTLDPTMTAYLASRDVMRARMLPTPRMITSCGPGR